LNIRYLSYAGKLSLGVLSYQIEGSRRLTFESEAKPGIEQRSIDVEGEPALLSMSLTKPEKKIGRWSSLIRAAFTSAV
jgi:hypothetical protein